MRRYDKYLNVRIDRIVDRAIEKLAEHWNIKKQAMKKKKGYRSYTARLAIVYAYLVAVRKINPTEAPDRAIEYLSTLGS